MQYRSLTVLALVASVGFASSVCAQPVQRSVERSGGGAEQPAVMKGPEVRRQTPPGVRGSFGGEEMQTGRRLPNQQFAMVQFWDAIMSLDASDVPGALALTDAQHEQLKTITTEHREKVGKELGRSMREGRPEGGRPEGRPQARPDARPDAKPEGKSEARPERRQPPAEGEARPERPARRGVERNEAARVGPEQRERRRAQTPDGAMERPAGVRGEAPAPLTVEQRKELQEKQAAYSAELQTRVWAVLTPPQKAYAEAELARIRAEFEAMTEEERVQSYMERRRQGAAQFGPGGTVDGGPVGGPAGGPGGRETGRRPGVAGGFTPEEREQMRARLEAMSPEDRAAAAKRLREARQNRQANPE